MPKTPRPEPSEPKQVDKFRDLARQLECDADEKAFEEKVKTVAKALQKPEGADVKTGNG